MSRLVSAAKTPNVIDHFAVCASGVKRTADSLSDNYEAAADRAADMVTAGNHVRFHTPAHPSPSSAHAKSQVIGTGAPLDAVTRNFMEDRFAADFSQVRVHADSNAAHAARDLRALAYADGEHLVFSAGRYQPHDTRGRHLVAHELAHVLQQREGAPPLQRKTAPPDPVDYDATSFTIAPPTRRIDLAEAQKLTQDAVANGELASAKVSGAAAGSDEEIMLHYTLAAAGKKTRWATEIDLITTIGFPPSAGGAAPIGKVTVRIDSKGIGEAVLISTGAIANPSTFPDRDTAAKEVTSKYKIKEVTDGDAPWTVGELNLVLGAFARIPAADINALEGVVLKRMHSLTVNGKTLAGLFEHNQGVQDTTVTNEATLNLADSVFPAVATNFAGGKSSEVSASFLTILHEVGHAVEVKQLRDASNARNKAIAERNEATGKYNDANDARNAEVAPLNALAAEVNKLKAPSQAAERASKMAEYNAQKAKFEKTKANADALNTKLEKAKTAQTVATDKADSATARPALEPSTTAAAAAAAAALTRAKAVAASRTAESDMYRTATDSASTALKDLASALNKKEFHETQKSAAIAAIASAESELENLKANHPTDPAITTFEPVTKAQRTWLDLLVASDQSKRLRKFVDFVKANKIVPFTKYAKDNWPSQPEEFFAEAYTLFLNDPEYLKANALALHDWFKNGSYK